MKTAVLDTNFLLIPQQFKIDIFSELNYLLEEYKMVVSSATVRELENISKKMSKAGRAAKFARKLLESHPEIEVIPTTLNADDFIVAYAKENRVVVCTNDIALKKRMNRIRVKLITLKSKAKIGFV
ncbi:MAG: PIN domain-containing protein [Candidatus Micrarchaeota archaeon]